MSDLNKILRDIGEVHDLEKFTAALAQQLFGMTAEQAQEQGICIKCKEPADARNQTALDWDEWRISGLCGTCFHECC